jgi:outer membrane lipoprotein carrier protein
VNKLKKILNQLFNRLLGIGLGWLLVSAVGFCAADSSRNPENHFKNLSAQFQQIIRDHKNRVITESTGYCEIQKPNQFYWHVTAPEEIVIVSDGHQIWHYDVELAQVIVRNFSVETQDLPIRFLFLAPEQILNADFNHKRFQEIQKTTQFLGQPSAQQTITLKPKDPMDLFQKIELIYPMQSKSLSDSIVLKQMNLWDQNNQKTEFKFKNIKLNPVISKSRFKFSPPEGVDVLNQIN